MKRRILAAVAAAVMMLSMFSMMVMPVVAEEINENLKSLVTEYAQYDFSLFTQGEAMASLYERALASDADADALLAEEKTIEKKLKNTYPYYVPYAQKEVYAAYTSGVKDWAITDAADWRAAVAAKKGFSGETLHLTNDIDMENINVEPMCTGGLTFAGTLNGHGYCFRNLLIRWDLAKSNYVGLIGYSKFGTVCELGLANGLVYAYGNQTTEAKVASLVGEGDSVTLRHCWSAVDVNSAEADGKGGQTTSGLARTRDNSVIDGCFSVGSVNGLGYSGSLSGYVQSVTKVYNSFAVGTALGSTSSFVRYNADGKVVNTYNSYSVGNRGVYCYANTSIDTSAYELEESAYTTGELAWKLNNGMVGDTVTYYTLKDGKTVFGNADSQVRRITMVCEGAETKYAYGVPGTQIRLNYASGASYSGEAEIVGTRLLVPNYDITVTVTLGSLDYNELDLILEQFAKADYNYIKNGQAAKALVEAVQARMDAGYADQAAIDADVKALQEAYEWVEPENFPSVQEVLSHPTMNSFTIGSLADLEYVATHKSYFTAAHTLYFTADITLPEGSKAHSLKFLQASLNGLGHTLSGITVAGEAWLGDYAGKSVQNLIFVNGTATAMPWQGAFLIEEVASKQLLLENLTFRNCTVTNGNTNGLGLVVGIQSNFGSLEMRGITVENCTLNRGSAGGNSAFLVGRLQNGTLVAEDCYLNNNTLTGTNTGGTGVAFGEMTGTATMKNIGIFNTKSEIRTNHGVLIGSFKDCDTGTSQGVLTFENIYSANNNLPGLICCGNDSGELHAGNGYTDGDALIYYRDGKGTSVGSGATAAESLCGGAYALNQAGVEKKWEFPAGGTAPVWDTDGVGLPVKVSFYSDLITLNYYTDTAGKVVNADEEPFKLGSWNVITNLATLKDTVFTADTTVTGTLNASYKILDQNLWVGGDRTNRNNFVSLVKKYEPDILLLQEGSDDWVQSLTLNFLFTYGIHYKYRYDKESCPVMWKNSRFEKVESGYFWISDTPDEESKGWDGGCYRIATWVVLKDKSTGEYVVACSFHLDHQGSVARDKGGPLVYQRLMEIAERYPGSMIIAAADFNCREGSIAYNTFANGELADCRYLAVESSTRPTHGNGTNADWSNIPDSYRIDFMMTDPDTAKVVKFQVLEEIYGASSSSAGSRISDHNGLISTVVTMAEDTAYCAHKWTVTDNGDGTHKRTCTAGCGYSEDLAHSPRYTAKDGVTHTVTCLYCESSVAENCTVKETVEGGSCTEGALRTRDCEVCLYHSEETLDPDPHTYEWSEEEKAYICSCGATHTSRDVNDDGDFNMGDIVSLLQYIVGKKIEIDTMAADVIRDNRVSIADAVWMMSLLSE